MKKSQIYRRAAERNLMTGEGACVSIHHSTKHRFASGHRWRYLSKEALEFQKLFCPLADEWYFDSWLVKSADDGYIEHGELKEWRVLALCFMAAVEADKERRNGSRR